VPFDDVTLDLAAFVDLVNELTPEAAGEDPADPRRLVVVDLDSPPARLPDRPAAGPRGVVVVGVSRSGAFGGPFEAFDVVLAEGAEGVPDGPSPWVVVPDVADALARLSECVALSPGAALTLVQVLRAGQHTAFADALTVESLAYSTLQGGREFARWLAGRPPPPDRPAATCVLSVEREGDVLQLVLDRPHVRNALNAALRDALCEALAVALLDSSVDEVQISGRGPDFCSGGDLDEFGTAPDAVSAHLVRVSRSPAAAISAVADRTVVRLHGACVGAGIEIAAAAHRVVAAADTVIRLPEVSMGLVPGAGGTVTLPRRIGRQRAAWLALSGVDLDAETACRWRLVDEIAGE